MKIVVIDGNYYLHRAWSVSVKTKNLDHLKKNTLSSFLSMVCNDCLLLKGTHILVVFDSKRSWRHDIFPDYKANRNKGAVEVVTAKGDSVIVDITAGSLVKDAKAVCIAAGLPTAQKKGYEGDDLIGSACNSLEGPKVFSTRDKDMSAEVTDNTFQFWPQEKMLLRPADVKKKFGVAPAQIAQYLALMGDTVDNIPGVPGVAHKTASKWLTAHGSIKSMLKDPKIRAKLLPHKAQLELALKLTTLKRDVVFKLEDLVPQKMDYDTLAPMVWSIPQSLKELADARVYASKKGLFGSRK